MFPPCMLRVSTLNLPLLSLEKLLAYKVRMSLQPLHIDCHALLLVLERRNCLLGAHQLLLARVHLRADRVQLRLKRKIRSK